jgi:hypothetical protein
MFVRGIVGGLIGALLGAAAGALILGLDTSFEVESSFIGPARDWWPLAAIVGALAGTLLGVAFGLFIALSHVGHAGTLIVGCLIGGFGILVLLFLNADRFFWYQRPVVGRVTPLLISLLAWPLIGLIIMAIASRLRK